MTEQKNEPIVGKVVGGVVGVAAAVMVSPLMLLTGPRGGGELLKGVFGGCVYLGDKIEREARGKAKK